MGKLSYLYNDYVKVSDAVVDLVDAGGSCVDANFPIGNLSDEQIALCSRTDAKVAVKFQIDLGATTATKKLQAFFIGNHNFTGGTFDINSYTANDYATGKTAEATNVAYRLLDVYHRISSAPGNARQYWELDLSNITTGDSIFEIGRVMMYDDLVQITEIEDYIKPRGYGFGNIINETKYGVRHTHKLTEKRELFEIAWNERVMTTLPSELRTLYESVYGDAHPFVYIPDIALTPCYYGYMGDPELLWAEIMGVGSSAHVGQITLRIIEAVRGKA